MRILVVSFRFPPFASMGAARVAGFCEEWAKLGHEVRVISAANQGLPETLANPLPSEWVEHVSWPTKAGAESGKAMAKAGWKRALVRAYTSFLVWPDTKAGWILPAVEVGLKHQPDVIFASGLPFSSLVAAERISRQLRVPWVAELRDPFVDNAYALPPYGWRRNIDLAMQRKLAPARWVVATPGMADMLKPQLGREVEVVLTGVDTERPLLDANPDVLTLVHTGEMYGGARDPSLLLDAIAGLSPEERSKIRVRFYGRDPGRLAEQINARNLAESVAFEGSISREESLRVQSEADILLMLTPFRANESYVLTGKLFEYLGAKRPIWVIGHPEGGAARFIRERAFGRHLADSQSATQALKEALSHKPGWVPRPIGVIDEELSRQHQANKLLGILQQVTP